MIQPIISTTQQDNTIFDVVFNIFPYIGEVYLVEAYVVSLDQEGFFAHIKQKAKSRNHWSLQHRTK